jgi:glycosyl transferase family 25
MDNIEKIIYINLEERTDRKDLLLKELSNIQNIDDKLIRFNAIKDTNNGAIGCTKSHIKCLEMAIQYNWKNVLILEDDAMWNNYENGINILTNLMNKSYDVILLGGTYFSLNEETFKLNKAHTTTAYVVSNHYYETLLNNFIEGLQNLEQTNISNMYCIDVYWHKLQAKDNWYIVNPALMIQRESYSDIEKQNVNYNVLFNMNVISTNNIKNKNMIYFYHR